jgi:hypothetical protein
MKTCNKYLLLFGFGCILCLFLSTDVIARTQFYLLPDSSPGKINCDRLEIKNNQVSCAAGDLLITYNLDHVKQIEVVKNGILHHFQNLTGDKIKKINKLGANEAAVRLAERDAERKQLLFASVQKYYQSLIKKIKHKSSGGPLNSVLLITGIIVLLTGSIGFLIVAFRENILWGLGCMFLPFVSFIFLWLHWRSVSKLFFISMSGITLLFLSTMSLPAGGAVQSRTNFKAGTVKQRQSGAFGNKKAGTFKCKGKTYCSEMSSCKEAKFYLRNCPGTKMDGDHDGIPCESQWCGH